MKKVYKYPINPISDYVAIQMPRGCKILTIQVQYEIPCIWALVDESQPLVVKQFRIVGTGESIVATGDCATNNHKMECGWSNYINSFQLDNGDLIFHVFEIKD